jgi:hypothetical protein
MVKHIWTVLCKESKIDPATNNITLIEAYDNIQISLNTEDKGYRKGLPIAVPFALELVSLFFRDNKGEKEEITGIVAMLDPKGKKLGEFPLKAQFRENDDRVRNITKFDGIALTISGTYLFQVFTHKKTNAAVSELVTAIPVNISVSVNGESL